MNNQQLIYLFDPLCGWCYGASLAIEKLSQNNEIVLLPTGLFTDTGRKMDNDFAQYAWENDQRIAKLTGVIFSQQYREQLLEKETDFDSRLMVNALSVVQRTQPSKTFAVLKSLQQARYIQGLDTTKLDVVHMIINRQGIDCTTEAILAAQALADQKITQGQALAQQLGLRGVPKLVLKTGQGYQVLPNTLLFNQSV